MISVSRSVLVFAATLALSGCAVERLLMPAPTLTPVASSDGETPRAIDIIYATDRKRVDGDISPVYGSGRSHSLAYGNARVALKPRETTFASIGAVADVTRYVMTLAHVEEYGRDPAAPWPGVEVNGLVVDTPEVTAAAAKAAAPFVREIQKRLAKTPTKDIYVYVHGVGNSFEDAALTMAELWNFLGQQGVPVLYTWPAGREGLLQAYGYDRESSEFTVFHMKRALKLLAQIEGAQRIHLIAHSRGTDVVLSALRELVIETVAARQNPRQTLRIHNVILAAPDLDVEVLIQRSASERLAAYISRLTVYTTREDKAIGLAELVFGSVLRLGRASAGELEVAQPNANPTEKNIALVEYTGAQTGAFGHDYFRTNKAVVADMVLTIAGDRDPGLAGGRPLTHLGGVFWQLDDSYAEQARTLCVARPGETCGTAVSQ